MAVNKPTLLWSTYQEKQLKMLTEVNKNVAKMTRTSDDLVDDISSIMEGHAKSLITAINDIWNDNYTDVTRYVPFIQESSRKTADNTGRTAEEVERLREEEDERGRRNEDLVLNVGDIIKNLDIEDKVKKAIESANAYSDLYNTIIQMTGASGAEAQGFRSEMVSLVGDLNDEIGNKLNPTEALQTMMAMSNSTNVSNLETLKEIAAPMLLAQETMNISLSNLTELSARMYTRYGLSSSKIERLVDNIRNSTEGQDVSEELILSALSGLEDNFSVFSNGNSELLDKMNNSMVKGVSFLEANYIDSQTYLNDLEEFLSPDVRDQAKMVKKYGADYAAQISAAVGSGDVDTALALQNQALSEMDIYEAIARGFSRDDWMNANATSENLGVQALEEYKKSIDEQGSMRESAEEKFITLGDQISNRLNSVASYLAKIQENIGIGFSDVAGIYYLSQNLGGTLGKALGVKGTGGLLATIGPALGIGAAAVGVGLFVKGIYDVVEKEYGDAGDPYQEALADTESEYGYGFRGVYNADTEKTDWSYSAFESAEEAAAYNPDVAFSQYLTDTQKDRSIWEKIVDNLLTGMHNQYVNPYDSGASYSTSLWKDDQETTYNSIKVLEEEVDPEVRAFYTNKNLLTDYGEIQDFVKNKDKYEEYYEAGMYLGSNGKWYYVDSDKLVPNDLAPESFDTGTNYVTKDQLALIHEGEAITPKAYNPAANLNELERLRSQEDSSEDISDILAVITELRDLVDSWKKDFEKASMVTKGRNAVSLRNVTSYRLG